MQNHFNSVSDRKWSLIGIEERLIDKLVQDLEISDFLARIVSSRSNSPFNSVIAKKWLDPKLKFDLPSPFILKDIDKAAWDLSVNNPNQKAGVFADGSYVPIFQVPPVYPRRALERGIEGCVMLKFTVTKVGSTRDPSVEWAVPPGIFDRAAMRSALKYKYKPQIRDGEAIEVPNVRTVVIFKIEDANKPVDYVPEGCD